MFWKAATTAKIARAAAARRSLMHWAGSCAAKSFLTWRVAVRERKRHKEIVAGGLVESYCISFDVVVCLFRGLTCQETWMKIVAVNA